MLPPKLLKSSLRLHPNQSSQISRIYFQRVPIISKYISLVTQWEFELFSLSFDWVYEQTFSNVPVWKWLELYEYRVVFFVT